MNGWVSTPKSDDEMVIEFGNKEVESLRKTLEEGITKMNDGKTCFQICKEINIKETVKKLLNSLGIDVGQLGNINYRFVYKSSDQLNKLESELDKMMAD